MAFGVMFHHFHDSIENKVQGSISADDLNDIIFFLKKNYRLINASDFLTKASQGCLESDEVCLTFDDGLRCQYEFAMPVLKYHRISAFFFIYTSIFTDTPDYLEVYRWFRTRNFQHIDEFYSAFFNRLTRHKSTIDVEVVHKLVVDSDYLSHSPFYSTSDRIFRFLRDQVLTRQEYDRVMHLMLAEADCDCSDIQEKLWMKEENVVDLVSNHHIVGLHSHNHPTQIHKLSRAEQKKEFLENHRILKKVAGVKEINSMSHPCGNCNAQTLKVLDELGVTVGFMATMAEQQCFNRLKIPRIDHSVLLNEMRSL